MEEKLIRPQENVSCGNSVRNYITNPQWSASRETSNNASNSDAFPVKIMSGFSRNAPSTGNQAVIENPQILSTIKHQSFPLTTSSVYSNLGNVGNREHERISPSKLIVYQPVAGCADDGCCSNPRKPTPYDGLIEDAFMRHCERAPNSSQTLQFKCRVCDIILNVSRIRYHLVAFHPELFFADIRSQLSGRQAAHFSDRCLGVLQGEAELGKDLITEEEKKGYKMKNGRGVWCRHCNTEKRNVQDFKYHLFLCHYDILEKTLKFCYPKSEVANVTMASEHVPNVEPGQKPNFRFAYNVAGDLGKGFAQKRKRNIANTVVTDEERYGKDFRYGKVTAWLNGQETGLGSGPNKRRNGTIPNVTSNLSSTPFPNNFSHVGISSMTESGNNFNTLITNQIKPYYSTTMAPANLQYFHPPAPVHEQHQAEINQQILASESAQAYSLHLPSSTGVMIDGVRERDVDLDIAMEYLQEEHFHFNTSINPSST